VRVAHEESIAAYVSCDILVVVDVVVVAAWDLHTMQLVLIIHVTEDTRINSKDQFGLIYR
jgi:hypothetical protein